MHHHYHLHHNRIGGVMVSVVASRAVYRGFEPRSGDTKDNEIGICCFSAKNAALRRKTKDWLARNQDNVSEWGAMSIRGLLFQPLDRDKIPMLKLPTLSGFHDLFFKYHIFIFFIYRKLNVSAK